jgi:hypothetical protein
LLLVPTAVAPPETVAANTVGNNFTFTYHANPTGNTLAAAVAAITFETPAVNNVTNKKKNITFSKKN